MHKNILLLTLRTFSATGGIEKVSRVVGKALTEMEAASVQIFSMWDGMYDGDEKYFSKSIFKAFGGKRISFIAEAVKKGIKSDIVILTHINLISVGRMIKYFSPRTKIILIAHGIEVWAPLLRGSKKRGLQKVDKIIAVSKHTKNILLQQNKIASNQITVINNCLDPFLPTPILGEKNTQLLTKYHLQKEDLILMTLTRLSFTEKNKGYEKVMEVLQEMLPNYPHLKYLLAGKYDAEEKLRIENLIEQYQLQDKIILTGFIADEDLAAHYNLADIYIMPSEKEGFGITFIEALYYQKPVISGNTDGSVDALLNGQLGQLIDPNNKEEMKQAIKNIIHQPEKYIPNQQLLMEHFSYPVYQKKWEKLIHE